MWKDGLNYYPNKKEWRENFYLCCLKEHPVGGVFLDKDEIEFLLFHLHHTGDRTEGLVQDGVIQELEDLRDCPFYKEEDIFNIVFGDKERKLIWKTLEILHQ